MTCVSYDGKSIVADRYWGGVYSNKLVKLNDGSILGYTGCAKNFQRVIDYFNGGGETPDVEDADILRVLPDGRAVMYDNQMDPLDVDVPIAVGSGATYALGVMWHGGDAYEAVLCAATFCPNTKVDRGMTSFEIGDVSPTDSEPGIDNQESHH